jgi:hypothetical protein
MCCAVYRHLGGIEAIALRDRRAEEIETRHVKILNA